MAYILSKSGSSVGWRDENNTSGLDKLMKSGSSVGWHLGQDAGTFLFKDGSNVGWRSKTFIQQLAYHGSDYYYFTSYQAGSTQNFNYLVQSSPSNIERRLVGAYTSFRGGFTNITTSQGTITHTVVGSYNPGCGYFVVTLPANLATSTIVTLTFTFGQWQSGLGIFFNMCEISGGIKATDQAFVGNLGTRVPASGTLNIPATGGIVIFLGQASNIDGAPSGPGTISNLTSTPSLVNVYNGTNTYERIYIYRSSAVTSTNSYATVTINALYSNIMLFVAT